MPSTSQPVRGPPCTQSRVWAQHIHFASSLAELRSSSRDPIHDDTPRVLAVGGDDLRSMLPAPVYAVSHT